MHFCHQSVDVHPNVDELKRQPLAENRNLRLGMKGYGKKPRIIIADSYALLCVLEEVAELPSA